MPKFFVENINNDNSHFILPEEESSHILKSLRMKIGDEIVLCDGDSTDYNCIISGTEGKLCTVDIKEVVKCEAEPSVKAVLYQCMPKSDKMELIVQKCVELGIASIVPVISSRCISRPDPKSLQKKTVRWNKIAREAAGQSRRGIVPTVESTIDFNEFLEQISHYDRTVAFYEAGGQPLKEIINKDIKSVAFIIGPEGGFSESEINAVKDNGGSIASLGKRILRTETAPIAALTAVMMLTDNLE